MSVQGLVRTVLLPVAVIACTGCAYRQPPPVPVQDEIARLVRRQRALHPEPRFPYPRTDVPDPGRSRDQIIPSDDEWRDDSAPFRERGVASWYGGKFHGRKTASGERYNKNELTAAHRTLPFGTLVRVRNLDTGLEVIVRITDRGPWIRGRIIDLSEAAARRIGMLEAGLANVDIEVLMLPPLPDS